MKSPAFVNLRHKTISDSDIRFMLQEMVEAGVSRTAGDLFGELAITPPSQRLIQNLTKTMVNLSNHEVSGVPQEFADSGLWPDEFVALVELDGKLSTRSLITARLLMNLKERLLLVKKLGGIFRCSRERSDGFLNIKDGLANRASR